MIGQEPGGDRATYRGWEAREEITTGAVTSRACQGLHDLLDRPGPPPVALPILWHQLAFTPACPQAVLGPDGHPPTGGLLPPMAGRRRMYAGSTVRRAGVLRVDEMLTRRAKVTSVVEKSGKTGPIVFVGVRSLISGESGWLVQEETIAYRDPGGQLAPSADDRPTGARTTRYVPDTRMLFRFSALTYNAHRIHYDRDYARDVEGYPGLLVHGPLQAVLLAESSGKLMGEDALTSFTFRSIAPAFDGATYEVSAHIAGGTCHLVGMSADHVAMTATAQAGDTDPVEDERRRVRP